MDKNIDKILNSINAPKSLILLIKYCINPDVILSDFIDSISESPQIRQLLENFSKDTLIPLHLIIKSITLENFMQLVYIIKNNNKINDIWKNRNELFSLISDLISNYKYNANWNIITDGLPIFRKILQILTGYEYYTIKSISISIYKLNLEKLSNIFQSFSNEIISYYNSLPSIKSNNYDQIFSSIKEINKNLKYFSELSISIADTLYGSSSLAPLYINSHPAVSGILGFISIVIMGPEAQTDAWDIFSHFGFSMISIILSPIEGTADLISFCVQNNISFYTWARAHWECIKNNWATALDPLNWFHSCIKNLIKEIN